MVDAENAQTHYADILVTLGNTTGLAKGAGQTFISHRSGLDSVTLWLADANPAKAKASQPAPTFTIAIFHSPQDQTPIYQANYRLPQSGFAGAFKITFMPFLDPPEQSYYIRIQPLDGAIQVQGRREDSYTFGTLLVNEIESSGDVAISMTYRYGIQALTEDLRGLFTGSWLVIPLGLVLLLPGWYLLDWCNLTPKLSLWNCLSISTGLSLAVIPLVMLWSSLAGIKWTAIGVKFVMLTLTLLAAWRIIQRRKLLFTRKFSSNDLVMVIILFLVVLLRSAMVRDLTFPAWVDAVHHALLTRLIQFQGGFPVSYQPVLSIDATAYHPGFHSGVAVFQWLSGLSLPESLLVYGQALNVLGVLAVSLFTHTITRSRSAATWAVLAAGLLTPLPAYLTSWGRYTHLTGMIIFSTIIAMTYQLRFTKLKNNRAWMGQFMTAGIAFGGLILVHYRVAAFLTCWWMVELLVQIGKWNRVKRVSRVFISLFSCGVLFVLPWIIPLLQNTLLPRLGALTGKIISKSKDFDPSLLTSGYGQAVLAVALLGLVILFFRRPRMGIFLCLWTGGLFLLANPDILGVPGGGFVNNISVEITLYLPIAMLAGYATAQMAHWLTRKIPFGRFIVSSLAVLIGLCLAFAGFFRLLPIQNPSTVLARAADLPAMTWISKNLPKGETIVINPFNWGYGLCAGSDGGYWIAPLTGHPTNPPPVLYGMEKIESVQKVQASCLLVTQYASDAQALWSYLGEEGIHYIYVGSRGGPLSPQVLDDSRLFKTIYQNAGTWVFKTVP